MDTLKELTHALVTPAGIISYNQTNQIYLSTRFFINTPKIWNNLPSVIKDTQSLEQLKTSERQHFQQFW